MTPPGGGDEDAGIRAATRRGPGSAASQGVQRVPGDGGEGAEMAETLWAAVPDPGHSRFIFKKGLQALQATCLPLPEAGQWRGV